MQGIEVKNCLLCGIKLKPSTAGKKKYCCIEHRKTYYRANRVKPKAFIPEPITIHYDKDIDYIEVPMRNVFSSAERSSILAGFKKLKVEKILKPHQLEVYCMASIKKRVNNISFITVNQLNQMIERYDKLYRENNAFLSYKNSRINYQRHKERLVKYIKDKYESNS